MLGAVDPFVGALDPFLTGALGAGWDPLHGTSPVHFAGHIHAKALHKALKGAGE